MAQRTGSGTGEGGSGRAPRLRSGRTSLETGEEFELGPGERVQAGKNRGAQVVPVGKRAFFQGKRRTDFLEWFAASGSVRWSAGKSGVSEKTVWKHRMNDPQFAEAFDRAQEQGVARAKALLLEGRRGARPIDIDGDWQAPDLDAFDPALLAKIVFDEGRRKSGAPRGGAAPRAASNAEVEAALAKRLALFSKRMRAEAEARRAPCPCCGQAFPAASAGPGEAEKEA
ncbi:MAG TPA: hypothetical protein VIA98_06925 [Allosphingosinicella sp.]|jgi:hypothetical protein